MTEERRPRIAPPPSVDDVISSLTEDRIGQVDFTATLAAEATDHKPAPAAAATVRRVPPPPPAPVVEEPVAEEPVAREPEPEPEPAAVVELVPEPVAPDTPVAETAPAEVARVVDEVAEGVIARIRATEETILRHIESLELEATRRYEMVTAQAELDAELIRLQSRREAHAIVTAARMRAGEVDDPSDDPDDEGHRLAVFSDAVARVADATESSLAAVRARTREATS